MTTNNNLVEPKINYCYTCNNRYLADETPKGIKEGFCSLKCVKDHYD